MSCRWTRLRNKRAANSHPRTITDAARGRNKAWLTQAHTCVPRRIRTGARYWQAPSTSDPSARNTMKRTFLLLASLLLTLDFAVASTRQTNGPAGVRVDSKRAAARSKEQSLSTTLRRGGEPWGGERDRDFHVSPLVIPRGRLLVTARDTIFMLNSNMKVLWKYSVGAPVLNKLILDSTGIIHGIAMDGIEFAIGLDGKKRWGHFMNGRANYAQIALYDRDSYLVVIDNSGYRENLSDNTITDRLALYRGEETVWARSFPRNAELCVWSGRIFAVTQTRRRTTLVELSKPSTGKN
jgi:hypothetical protein